MRLVIQVQQASVSLSPHHITSVIWLKQLLATLNNQTCITATSYSKVSRGLRFPLEISGLCTGMESSGDSYQGQWRPRYAIHAIRHSIGKVLRSRLLLQSFVKKKDLLTNFHWRSNISIILKGIYFFYKVFSFNIS